MLQPCHVEPLLVEGDLAIGRGPVVGRAEVLFREAEDVVSAALILLAHGLPRAEERRLVVATVPRNGLTAQPAGAAAVCEDAGLEVVEAAPDGGYAAVLGHVVGMDTRFFSDEEIHRVHELPHWKDLDNLHHKVSYHLSTKLVARKPPSN